MSFGIIELCKYVTDSDPNAVMGLAFIIPQAGWIFGINFADIVLGGTAVFSLYRMHDNG